MTDRLYVARQIRGFSSRNKLARVCGISTTACHQHENGTPIKVEDVMIYCNVLKISIVWLLYGSGSPLIEKNEEEEKVFENYLSALKFLKKKEIK